MNLEELKRQGCIIAKEQPTDAQYELIFGSEIPQEVFSWEKFLPIEEWQKSTNGCVAFSRLNCAESVAKRDGLALNLSDRHLFVISGTAKNGNTLNAVSESFRTLGVVREEYFEWKPEMLDNQSACWEEIFDTSSIPSDARRYKGGNHSWIKNKSAMKSALAFSPLQLAIGVGDTYFFRNSEGMIENPKEITAYHAILCYWIDKDGNYYIFDSAGDRNPFKILNKDYPIEQCKSFRDLPSEWKLTQAEYETKQKEKTIFGIIGEILSKLAQILGLMKKQIELLPITPQPPTPIIDHIPLPQDLPKYDWSTKEKIRHACRVIMDEYNLSWDNKKLLCAVIESESDFNPKAVGKINSNGTQDFGLCQFNNGKNKFGKPFWIGNGADFKDIDEVLNNPEKNVRVMIREYKKWGYPKWWVSYTSGAYKKFL